MAPMIRAVAVCFVALCGLRATGTSGAAATTEAAGDALYLLLNLARNGKLPVRIETLKKSESLVSTVTSALPSLVGDDQCANAGSITVQTAEGFFVSYTGQSPNYADLIQTALTAGLQKLAAYPSDKWGSGSWSTDKEVGLLGYLLWHDSTEVGCVASKCAAGTNVTLCRFKPTAASGQFPFSEEYYNGLKARTTSLADLTADDLDTSSGVTVPSVLFGGLVAMLALASV
ncbi:SAG family member [Cyclospora cayetanensis]|uniref:SAG family member n=1 Tax=Cyclospora cayetanensis TaxID=88456 RepID=A0A1D3CUC5_9EIME|nr:SAG family member [Cyclospora cayetanensis]